MRGEIGIQSECPGQNTDATDLCPEIEKIGNTFGGTLF